MFDTNQIEHWLVRVDINRSCNCICSHLLMIVTCVYLHESIMILHSCMCLNSIVKNHASPSFNCSLVCAVSMWLCVCMCCSACEGTYEKVSEHALTVLSLFFAQGLTDVTSELQAAFVPLIAAVCLPVLLFACLCVECFKHGALCDCTGRAWLCVWL